jgi:hypothetical protein
MVKSLALVGSVLVVLAASVESGTGAPAAQRASSACTVPFDLPAPPAERPVYTLRFRVSPRLKEASGTLAIAFRPEVATHRIVLRLWPNSPFYAARGSRLTVGEVKVGSARTRTSRPNATTLVVHHALAAGEPVALSMPWSLRLPRGNGFALKGGGTSARLVSFFPLLAWDGSGWATDPPLRRLDSFWSTSPTADFDVRISAPRGLRVLATGREVGTGHWRAEAVRDFSVTVGSFVVRRTTVRLPRQVRVLVALEQGSSYPVGVFLTATLRSLRSYAERYGPYPWSTYTAVVMTDFGLLSGFAYPTITFLGDSSAVLIPHETAHHWFYSLVGNDQSRHPWLSEGLATWAQTGPEGSLPALRSESIPADVRNRIGEPMSFWEPRGFPKLRLGVYVQTAQALDHLGDPDDVDCALRGFVTGNAYRTAVPRDLLAAFEPFFPDTKAKLSAYGARF